MELIEHIIDVLSTLDPVKIVILGIIAIILFIIVVKFNIFKKS